MIYRIEGVDFDVCRDLVWFYVLQPRVDYCAPGRVCLFEAGDEVVTTCEAPMKKRIVRLSVLVRDDIGNQDWVIFDSMGQLIDWILKE